MKIVVTGTRGVPDIQGGVETHCEELFPRIAALGHDVTIIRRSCYTDASRGLAEYKGVKLRDIYAPRKKSFEAVIHTFLAVVAARRMKADIIHIHAIGPSIMTPFARLLGLKVVTTNHGPDYDRGKWGRMAKTVLRWGEKMGAKHSHKVIVISKVIADILKREYGRADTELIFNGVNIPKPSERTDYIDNLGLTVGKYVLGVGRFVPEKNFHLLMDAFAASGLKDRGYKLVIAGDADHEDEYSRMLKRNAAENGVVLTGFIKGEPLHQLQSHAGLFVLPSTHEGLPISLLEAMSHGRDVLVSRIAANCLPELSETDFFSLDGGETLADALQRKLPEERGLEYRDYDLSAYDWNHIALQTVEVYHSAMYGNNL